MIQPAPITEELAEEINQLSFRMSPDVTSIYRLKKKAKDLMHVDPVAAHCLLAKLYLISWDLPKMEDEIRILSSFPKGIQNTIIPILYIGANNIKKAESYIEEYESYAAEDRIRFYLAFGRFSDLAEDGGKNPDAFKAAVEQGEITPETLRNILSSTNATDKELRDAVLIFNEKLFLHNIRCHRIQLIESGDIELPPLIYEKQCSIEDVSKLLDVRDSCYSALARNASTSALNTIMFRVNRIHLN